MARREFIKPEEVSGKTFGEWTVLSFGEKKSNQIYWWCRCSCGLVKLVCQSHLVNGKSTCCVNCAGLIRSKLSLFKRKSPRGKYLYKSGMQERFWADARRHQYELQNGICPICLLPLPENPSDSAWDHDHKTDECREILHVGCNLFIWRIEEDPLFAKRTLDYLEKHRAN